jgi:hypothetical protein
VGRRGGGNIPDPCGGRPPCRCTRRSPPTDYFGENNNATKYGLVYSAKLASAIVGIGIGSAVTGQLGYTGAYVIGGIVALVAAGIISMYRQPGDKYHHLIAEEDRPNRSGKAAQMS